MIGIPRDITGLKTGRLTVLYPTHMRRHGYVVWCCRCECGNICYYTEGELTRKRPVVSCGCAKIHPIGAFTAEERAINSVLHGMKCRCLNKNDHGYPNYGGRGITICNEWLPPIIGAKNFVKWAKESGYAPGLSIDRIDNNGPYAPWNCRWVTAKEQAENRRSTLMISVDGVSNTAAEWGRILGDYSTHIHYLYNKYGSSETVNYIREKLKLLA